MLEQEALVDLGTVEWDRTRVRAARERVERMQDGLRELGRRESNRGAQGAGEHKRAGGADDADG